MSVNNDNGLIIEPEAGDKAVEVIKLIARAEDSGRKRREFAESEAKLIVSEASEKAEKSAAFEKAKAEEKIKKIKELTEQKGRELAINILTQVNEECDELKQNARENKQDALAAVVERIVNEWR
jgi:vacuolar-type H+-ATPase subunit H